MTHQLVLTGRFKKALKRAKKRGLDIENMTLKVDTLVLESVIYSQTGY